jgi:hypothetical protein
MLGLRAHDRDRWLGRVREITVATVLGAIALIGLLAAAAASTFPGHQVSVGSSSGTSTSGAAPSNPSAPTQAGLAGSAQPQAPPPASISAGTGPASVATGAS